MISKDNYYFFVTILLSCRFMPTAASDVCTSPTGSTQKTNFLQNSNSTCLYRNLQECNRRQNANMHVANLEHMNCSVEQPTNGYQNQTLVVSKWWRKLLAWQQRRGLATSSNFVRKIVNAPVSPSYSSTLWSCVSIGNSITPCCSSDCELWNMDTL